MTDGPREAGAEGGSQGQVGLRILFVGPSRNGTTTEHRIGALEKLGHSVRVVSTLAAGEAIPTPTVVGRIGAKLSLRGIGGPPRFVDRSGANEALLEALAIDSWDLLWLEKALTISGRTLEEVRRARPEMRIVGFSPDDMVGRHNQSRQFLEQLHHYDVFFTTKSYCVAELEALGCRQAVFVQNGFDPGTHRPVAMPGLEKAEIGGPVGFIGTYEDDRARQIRALVRRGIPVRVYGSGWPVGLEKRGEGLRIERQAVFGERYARIVCSFDMNLHFLRKANRDLQTTRSIEIPACGAFMLAERTREHLDLFEEGREAEYFASGRELEEKVRYYLDHPREREAIGRAGRERCLKSGYSNLERLRFMLARALDDAQGKR